MVVVIASFAGVRATCVTFAHFPHNVVSIVETWVDWYTIYSDSNSAGYWKTNANIHASIFARAKFARNQRTAMLRRECRGKAVLVRDVQWNFVNLVLLVTTSAAYNEGETIKVGLSKKKSLGKSKEAVLTESALCTPHHRLQSSPFLQAAQEFSPGSTRD